MNNFGVHVGMRHLSAIIREIQTKEEKVCLNVEDYHIVVNLCGCDCAGRE